MLLNCLEVVHYVEHRCNGVYKEHSVKGHGIRPVKILLPADLADRVDEAVTSELGGFRDRHSLAAAAIDAYLLDLLYANESDQPVQASEGLPGSVTVRSAADLAAVAALPRGRPTVDTVSALVDEPLLGLHNRDWPSLWALSVLGELAAEAVTPWRSFLPEVTIRAWEVAEKIKEMSASGGRKPTALLPTNKAKAHAAESAFQSFGVASVGRRPDRDGKFAVSGPLPLWRAIAFVIEDGELCAGVTGRGWDLLGQMAGLTPAAPHGPEMAEMFFRFLRDRSRTDWWGFETMLAIVAGSPTRDHYIEGFTLAREWRASVAASAAQGYLARGREWGLVEPKIVDGRYVLTDFGKELASV
jgi:hypothetical protein